MSDANAKATNTTSRWLGRFALAAAAVLIWLCWIDRPEPPRGQLDDSWQAVLGHANTQDLQFGREVLFTHGPWGWLMSHFLMEDSLLGKRIWEIAGKLFLATGTVWLSLRLPLARRVCFLILLPACGLYFPDTHLAAMITLGVLLGLMDDRARATEVTLILAAIGFLSTMKFTYAVLGMSGVGLTVLARVVESRWREGALLAAGATVSFLAAWLLGGQSFVHLLDHIRMSLELSAGYSAAMSIDEPLAAFLAGASATLILLTSCTLAISSASKRLKTWPAAVHLGFVTFVMWKHGFNRADGHVFALFNHAILLGICAAPALQWRRKWDPFLLASAAGVTGVFVWNAPFVSNAPVYLRHNLQNGFNFVIHPAVAREGYERAIQARRVSVALPEVLETVGDASIDAINYHQGVLLLNEMNYTGRPVIQSYSVYTPTLLRRNWRFIQRERAPEFLLWSQGTIDGRFPSQDDSLLIAEIPRRYEPVREASLGLLLRKRTTPPAQRDPVFESVVGRHVAWGETLALPDAPSSAVWLEVLFDQSFIGTLRSTIYKPGRINMVITDSQGRETTHRVIPGIAEVGFLIHPFLESQEDINLLMRGKARLAVRSLRFEPVHKDERELWTGIHVRLFRMPEIPLQLASPFAHYERLGVTNLIPESVSSSVSVELITNKPPNRVLVHPPGRMEFQISGETRCLTGSFGIREGAYTGTGATDGATFSIEAEDHGGQRKEIWNRTLRPLTETEDRGLQRFQICAPEGTARLILHSTGGDNNNTDWDWTFWAELQFGQSKRNGSN